jgi:hypothetical protein
MTLLSIQAHGATGTWLDEIIEVGVPLVVLVFLYIWSNKKPREDKRSK